MEENKKKALPITTLVFAIIASIPGFIIIGILMTPLITTCIMSNSLKSKTSVSHSEYLKEYKVGAEDFDWYKHIGTIQTFTAEEPPATVRATVYLGYKQDDKATLTEIIENQVGIKEFLRCYFRGKSASELKNVNNEEKFKIEIRNGINDRILSKSKIREISFAQLDIVEQN